MHHKNKSGFFSSQTDAAAGNAVTLFSRSLPCCYFFFFFAFVAVQVHSSICCIAPIASQSVAATVLYTNVIHISIGNGNRFSIACASHGNDNDNNCKLYTD